MSRITFEALLEAGAHFGHIKRKRNPAMAPYIYEERNGINLIDLHKTVTCIETAADALKQIAKSGRTILFVATKKQAQGIVAEQAKTVEMPYVAERWAGGMLTNFPTIRKAVKKMNDIEKMKVDGKFKNLSKRENLQIDRQQAKLNKNLGSIKDMNHRPAALFVVDVMKEHIAVREANRLRIPVFGIVDTNSNPNNIDFVIPANDDSTKAISLILEACCAAISEGKAERTAERVDEDTANKDAATQAPKSGRSRRPRAGKPQEETDATKGTATETTAVAE